MECLTASTGCSMALRSTKVIRVGVVLAIVLLLAQAGVLAFGGSSSDSFGFFESVISSSAFSRGGLDRYGFGESALRLVQTLRTIQDGLAIVDHAARMVVLSRGLGDLYDFSVVVAGKATFSRGPGDSYVYKDVASVVLLTVGGLSCTAQLAAGHSCNLVGTTGNETFLIDTCELSSGSCLLSGNYTISAVGGRGADTFNITDGLGSNTYSINAGNGNATFYVDACNGASPDNFSISFQVGPCTNPLPSEADVNSYSLLGGGNARSPNTFVILDGNGTNTYALTGGAGPDNFTIYGGEGRDAYAIVGGAGSSVTVAGGNGTETYSMICGSASLLNITVGSGQEQFGIIAGPGSVLSIGPSANSSIPVNNVYNIVF